MGGGSSGFLNFSLPLTVTRASLGCCRTSRKHDDGLSAPDGVVFVMGSEYIGDGVGIWGC